MKKSKTIKGKKSGTLNTLADAADMMLDIIETPPPEDMDDKDESETNSSEINKPKRKLPVFWWKWIIYPFTFIPFAWAFLSSLSIENEETETFIMCFGLITTLMLFGYVEEWGKPKK